MRSQISLIFSPSNSAENTAYPVQLGANLSSSLECGVVDDGCGGEIDLRDDCDLPSCGANATCGDDNKCTGCVSDFRCSTTTAECGMEVDNCGVEHDVVAECEDTNGCGELGTCTDINLCGACTRAQPHLLF